MQLYQLTYVPFEIFVTESLVVRHDFEDAPQDTVVYRPSPSRNQTSW